MNEIPVMMRAIDVLDASAPDELRLVERPVPRPEDDDVLIRVHAAGLNRPDILQRKGLYPPPPGAPSILGLEVAGVVAAVGRAVDPGMIGKSVCALVPGGGYADFCAASAAVCLPVPQSLSMVEAAAMPETLYTVWTNLFERGYAVEGETVLVHGGTSGIGTMAIALARLFGIKIIVTAGTDEKCARALALGASFAINYREQDFVTEVKRITSGRGCSVVLDMVGGDYVPRNLQCLSEDGRHISIAVQGGATATIPIFDIMRRRLTLTGSTLRPRDVAFKVAVTEEIAQTVWPFVETGQLRPVIDRVFPLTDASAAHAYLESGGHVGKVVLDVAC